MTTIYISEDVGGTTTAAPTEAAAKVIAKAAHDIEGGSYRVMKVELAKLGTRELLCALYNNETTKFVGTKEVIYTAPAQRGRKAKVEEPEEAPEGNPEGNPEEDFSDI
jgi:hypothetical protein